MPDAEHRDAERSAANKLVFAALELHHALDAEHYTAEDVDRLERTLAGFRAMADVYERELDGWLGQLLVGWPA
jgi:hypothetical protein